MLGDVQVRDHLDPGNNGESQTLGRRRHFVKGAINPVTNFEFFLERLEMNIGGLSPNGLLNDQINESDNGGFVGRIRQIVFLCFVQAFEILQAYLPQKIAHRTFFLGVISIQKIFNVTRIANDQMNLQIQSKSQVVDDGRIERIGG